MQKFADAADISVLFFSAGANFWTILGHFWAMFGNFWQFWVIFGPIWAILGHFWAILGNSRSFLGHLLVLIFWVKKLVGANFLRFLQLWQTWRDKEQSSALGGVLLLLLFGNTSDKGQGRTMRQRTKLKLTS